MDSERRIMNTPKPCDTCKQLYVDAMQKDNPLCMAECKLGLPLDIEDCPFYALSIDYDLDSRA